MTMRVPDFSEFQFPPRETPGASLAGVRAQNGGAAIIRISYGTSHPDAGFSTFRQQAHDDGYSYLGIYQYIVAGQPARAQAQEFARLLGPGGLRNIELPKADIEEGAGDQA